MSSKKRLEGRVGVREVLGGGEGLRRDYHSTRLPGVTNSYVGRVGSGHKGRRVLPKMNKETVLDSVYVWVDGCQGLRMRVQGRDTETCPSERNSRSGTGSGNSGKFREVGTVGDIKGFTSTSKAFSSTQYLSNPTRPSNLFDDVQVSVVWGRYWDFVKNGDSVHSTSVRREQKRRSW